VRKFGGLNVSRPTAGAVFVAGWPEQGDKPNNTARKEWNPLRASLFASLGHRWSNAVVVWGAEARGQRGGGVGPVAPVSFHPHQGKIPRSKNWAVVVAQHVQVGWLALSVVIERMVENGPPTCLCDDCWWQFIQCRRQETHG